MIGAEAPQVVLPPDVRELRVGPPVRVGLLDVRLALDAVEVLREPREHEREQLLRVVLLVARELVVELGDRRLERARVHAPPPPLPQLGDEVRVPDREAALRAHRVGRVEVGLVRVREEVAREQRRVREALEARVHEARVAEVVQPVEPVADLVRAALAAARERVGAAARAAARAARLAAVGRAAAYSAVALARRAATSVSRCVVAIVDVDLQHAA